MPPDSSRQRESAHAPAPDESDAMQIGRDDAKAFVTACPFPQGSGAKREWREGQQRERDGK